VVLNKLDILESDPEMIRKAKTTLRQRIAGIRGTFPIQNEPFIISAVSGQGVEELLFAIHRELKTSKDFLIDENRSLAKKTALPDDEGMRA
jgi:predicted GTPase